MQTERGYCGVTQRHVGITYFCWRNRKKYQDGRKPHVKTAAWSYDMEGHAEKWKERYCELANTKAKQVNKVSSSCLDDNQIKEELESVAELLEVDFAGDLTDSTSTSVGMSCFFSEVAH